MHQIERAIFDLRRGLPVIIDDHGGESALVYPLECLTDPGITRLVEQAGGEPALTVSRHRMQAMGYPISVAAACLPLSNCEVDSAELIEAAISARSAHSEMFDAPRPAGPSERAALALMRRALLIPAAVTARIDPKLRPELDQRIRAGELLAVEAREAEHCFDHARGMLRRVSEADVPLAESAESRFVLFREPDGLREHLAVVIGQSEKWSEAVPVRLHSACLTGDLFASLRCDCGEQLRTAIETIAGLGGGVLLYLAQEGRGIGLANKLRAYALQDQGHDTVEADGILGFGEDERRYGVAVDMLNNLDIRRVHLLTNNPVKVAALANGGIEVARQDRLYGRVTDHNRRYLTAKASRSGHLLDELLDES